jgi:uncharacterized membrane protein YbhN (UPF0104 family)
MHSIPRAAFQRLSKIIIVIFYIALIAFLVYYIQKIDYNALKSIEFVWHFVIIASLFGLAMRYWQIVSWLVILKDLGAQGLKRSRVELSYVYAKSWLGRYIPGTAPWILGKIYFASKHGISKSKLAVSSLLEAILQVTVVLGLSSILLMTDSRFGVIDQGLRIIMAAILVACIIVTLPPVFNRVISLVYKIVRRKPFPAEHRMPTKTLFKGVVIYAIGGVLNGLFLFFLAKSIYPELGYENLLFVIGAVNLAGALGILAIFTPSGLGVRDGILLLLFNLVMPPEFALAITILARLWDVVLDLIFFTLAWLGKVIKKSL